MAFFNGQLSRKKDKESLKLKILVLKESENNLEIIMIIFQFTVACLAFKNAFLFTFWVLETDFHCRTLNFIFRDHDNGTTVTQDDGNLIFPSVKFSSHFFFFSRLEREYLKMLIQINFYPFLFFNFLISHIEEKSLIFHFFDLFLARQEKKLCCTIPNVRCNNIDFAD